MSIFFLDRVTLKYFDASIDVNFFQVTCTAFTFIIPGPRMTVICIRLP